MPVLLDASFATAANAETVISHLISYSKAGMMLPLHSCLRSAGWQDTRSYKTLDPLANSAERMLGFSQSHASLADAAAPLVPGHKSQVQSPISKVITSQSQRDHK